LDMKAVSVFIFFYSVLPCQADNQIWRDSVEERLAKLEQEKPYLSVCAYRESHRGTYKSIPYDSVFHLSTNIEEGGLDTCTGKFLFGLSGTYSVSWNYFSDSKGPGRNVVLKKNNRDIKETQGTWTLQGRTVLIDMEEGETLELNYNDYNDYGVERVTFCISLVHEHTIKTVASYTPDMRILPRSDSKTYHLQLSGNNDHLADRVEVQLENNKKNNSRACLENTPRNCEKRCNSYTKRKCELGCSFDYNLLGDCKDKPYGYNTIGGQDTTVNPCFFLYFEPVQYWNPDPKEPPRGPPYGYVDGYPVPESPDELQFTCVAKKNSEKIDLYSLLLEIDDTDRGPIDIQRFIDDKELFYEMANLGGEIEELINAQRILDNYYREQFEFSKVIDMLNATREMIKDRRTQEIIDELLDFEDENAYWKLKSVLNFHKSFVRLNLVDQKTIKEKLIILSENNELKDSDSFHENLEPKAISDLSENKNELEDPDSFHENLEATLCSIDYQDNHHCPLLGIMYNMHSGVIKSYKIRENWVNFKKFLDTLILIEQIKNKNTAEATYIEILQAGWIGMLNNWPRLRQFSENRKMAEKLDKYSPNVLSEFEHLQHILNRKKEEKENINLSFYPRRQSIPTKYFPLTGEEDTPYVAVKLHLQDKPGLVPGQEILVQCKAWYKDVVHQDRPGSGMVEFKIKLE